MNKETTVNWRLAIFLVVLTTMIPATTFAQTACTDVLIDPTGIVKNTSQITSGTDVLKRAGADIHIAVTQKRSSEFSSVESSLRSSCPKWQGSSNTGRSSSLLLIIVSEPDKQAAIYYGPAWVRQLDTTYRSVIRETMNPRFEAGDFERGLALGLERLAGTIAPPPAAPPTPSTSSSTQEGVAWMPIILVVVIGGLTIWWIFVLVAERSGRIIARDKARSAQERAATTITDSLSGILDQLIWDTKQMEKDLSETDRKTIAQALSTAQELYGQACGRLATAGDVNASIFWMGRTGFSQMEDTCKTAEKEATAAIETAAQIIKAHRTLLEQAPKTVAASQEEISKATTLLEQVGKEYNTSTLQQQLATATALLSEATEYLTQRSYALAQKKAEQARTIATQVMAQAKRLPSLAQHAGQKLREAQQSCRSAQEYLTGHKTQLDGAGLTRTLTTLQQRITQEGAILTQTRPDYLVLTNRIEQIQQEADRVFASAHKQVQDHERLVSEVTRLSRQTESGIASVRKQMERTRYSGRKGTDKLTSAEALLKQSMETTRPIKQRHNLVSSAYADTLSAAQEVGRVRTSSSSSRTTSSSSGDSGFVFISSSDGGYSGSSSSGSSSSCGGGGSSSSCGGGGGGGCGGGGN